MNNNSLHQLLDFNYGSDGDTSLRQSLAKGANVNARWEGETPLHVAARRRRLNAVKILLDHGADINATNTYGKTAYAHSLRRGFHEIAEVLATRGADKDLTNADRLAVAFANGDLKEARKILYQHPNCARTGNPGEDRLLADLAGRNNSEPIQILISAGADLTATGLDSGTPLHQAAWFGQPDNARLLIEAGAPLDIFDEVHGSSPLGWAVHGSRYSGGAAQRQDAYMSLVQMLLDAGSNLQYPGETNSDDYLNRLRADASPQVKKLLPQAI